MSSKSADNKNSLPDGWIRKESKSRPNQFYYFNKKTGESLWEPPSQKEDDKIVMAIKPSVPSFNNRLPSKEGNIANKHIKLSDKSKEVKKIKPKTPAQDRLKNLALKNDAVSASIKKSITSAVTSRQTTAKKRPADAIKSSIHVTNSTFSLPKLKKDNEAQAISLPLNAKQRIIALNSTASEPTKIKQKPNPVVLKPNTSKNADKALSLSKISNTIKTTVKTPAQQRLKNLQSDLIKKTIVAKRHDLLLSKSSEKANVNDKQLTNSKEQIIAPVDPIRKKIISQSTTFSTLDAVNRSSSEIAPNSIAFSNRPIITCNLLAESIVQNGEKSVHISDDEQMDWEPSNCDATTDDCFQNLEDMEFADVNDLAYIVPDTNVFLSSLICVKDIIEKDAKYRVLVPYMVLQELDKLKNKQHDTVSRMATRAIKFIYEYLKDGRKRLQGQKATDDSQHLIDIDSPDDKILNCCLQLKEQSREVILITNDINLGNKAMSNGIETMSSKRCLQMYEN